MQDSPASRLVSASSWDLDSPTEWLRAQDFFYGAMWAVVERLPPIAREHLIRRGPTLPEKAEREAASLRLWKSIQSDSMGNTAEGAAIRATLFGCEAVCRPTFVPEAQRRSGGRLRLVDAGHAYR